MSMHRQTSSAPAESLTASEQVSFWAPLRHRLFVGLWLACAIANLAIWMQTVGAAWIMTQLTASPLMVSLVQTAITLPVFLFGLPGGVLADRMDPRRLLLVTQSAMLVASAVLCLLAWSNLLQAWSLLLFTFILGSGSALGMAAWMTTLVGVLPREQVPAAVSLCGISINATRALGPALAGALIAWWSTASVFLAITLCMGVVIVFICVRLPASARAEGLPPETLTGGMRSGLRYIRHSAVLSSALKQVFVFTSCASALWALLPLVAKDELDMHAGGYGLLMAFMGAGAVLAALGLTSVYHRFSLRRLIVVGAAAFAAATLAAALSDSQAVICAMLVLAGMGWMAVNATISTVVQTYAANWVRARVASVYLLVLMGSMALGGALWGVLAQYLGLGNSLLLSASSILLGLLLTRRGEIVMGREADFADAQQTDKLVLAAEVAHDDGPVCIEVSYRVVAAERDAFLRAVYAIGQTRRRNGARNWRLYRDVEETDHYIERFIVESWLDYLRQRGRMTQNDEAQELALVRFRDERREIKRYIYQTPAEQI
ncbi:MFS transporter [Pseudomonas sp. NPDC077186]|jgi:MFS family permease|uniref:MFS transporter n=1 Tax=Pseudomonadaceae TaxID=135621 RepID=UPI0018A7A2B5|nr:MFS transporter [Pseudomonas hydrolytica]MBF8161593.1 MFS transporter [Pseudomonas mendocina]UTH33868.1 MFS transporter [Pseudomonas hydrolytica]UZZ13138.1 MFS transporter [Pseudomonas mendocina]